MKHYYAPVAFSLFLFIGCEGLDDGNKTPGQSTSTPVTYTYNMNHPGLEDISFEDVSKLKSENQAALTKIIEDIKVDNGRRPQQADELYIFNDELKAFEAGLQNLRNSHRQSVMYPVYEQQVALLAVDQWLALPEGEAYSADRLEMISELTNTLIDVESHDTRVLANALLLLKATWSDVELLDGIAYVESVATERAASGSAEAFLNPALPLHIRAAQVHQQEQTKAALAELTGLKALLSESE